MKPGIATKINVFTTICTMLDACGKRPPLTHTRTEQHHKASRAQNCGEEASNSELVSLSDPLISVKICSRLPHARDIRQIPVTIRTEMFRTKNCKA